MQGGTQPVVGPCQVLAYVVLQHLSHGFLLVEREGEHLDLVPQALTLLLVPLPEIVTGRGASRHPELVAGNEQGSRGPQAHTQGEQHDHCVNPSGPAQASNPSARTMTRRFRSESGGSPTMAWYSP